MSSDRPKRAGAPQAHVARAHAELSVGVTHRRAAIAAPARLMEHQRPVHRAEATNERHGGLRCLYARVHQKKPMGLGS